MAIIRGNAGAAVSGPEEDEKLNETVADTPLTPAGKEAQHEGEGSKPSPGPSAASLSGRWHLIRQLRSKIPFRLRLPSLRILKFEVGPPLFVFAASLMAAAFVAPFYFAEPWPEVEEVRQRQQAILQRTYERWRALGGIHAHPETAIERRELALNLLHRLTSPSSANSAIGFGGSKVHAEPMADGIGPACVRLSIGREVVRPHPDGAAIGDIWGCTLVEDSFGGLHWVVFPLMSPDRAPEVGLPVFDGASIAAWYPRRQAIVDPNAKKGGH